MFLTVVPSFFVEVRLGDAITGIKGAITVIMVLAGIFSVITLGVSVAYFIQLSRDIRHLGRDDSTVIETRLRYRSGRMIFIAALAVITLRLAVFIFSRI